MMTRNIKQNGIIQNIPAIFYFFISLLAFTSQSAVSAEISTLRLDNEIAEALNGLSSQEKIDKAAAISEKTPIPSGIIRTPMFLDGYKNNLSTVIKSKRKLAKIALNLHSANWRAPKTIKLAAEFKIMLERFNNKKMFDKSALEKINRLFLSRIKKISNFPLKDGKYYLDVDKKTLKTKTNLLVFNTFDYKFGHINNPDYKYKPLEVVDQQLVDGGRINRLNDDEMEYRDQPNYAQVDRKLRVHVYIKEVKYKEEDASLGRALYALADKLHGLKNGSDVVIVAHQTVISYMKDYIKGFKHKVISYMSIVKEGSSRVVLYENKRGQYPNFKLDEIEKCDIKATSLVKCIHEIKDRI